MLAPLVALWVSASPAAPVNASLAPTLLAKKKAKKAKAKEKEKDKGKAKPPETSEGIDLNATPEATPDPAPVSVEAADPKPQSQPAAVEAEAPPPTGSEWSIVTPQPVGAGRDVIEAGVGWPGLEAAYWRGIVDAFDAGARVTLNWGYEGQFTLPQLGVKIQVQGRYKLFESGALSLGATFAPGFVVYFGGVRGTRAGLTVPLEATLGLKLVEKLGIGINLDIPFWVLFGVGAVIPLLVGGGVDYHLSERLALFLKLAAGPSFWTNGAPVIFTLDARVGAAFRL